MSKNKTKNLTVKILIGIPTSGKTTWSQKFVDDNKNWVRINRDDLRWMLTSSYVCEPKIEKLIDDLQEEIIISSLAKKLNVIVDNTNISLEKVNKLISLCQYHADIEFMIFDTSLKKALEINAKRSKHIPEETLKGMYKKYTAFVESFDSTKRSKKTFKYVPPTRDANKENVILCDIDGTLARVHNRNIYDLDNVENDIPDLVLVERLRQHSVLGEKVILVSGRDESSREATERWLAFYDIPYYKLYVRKNKDDRRDAIVKKEIYQNEIEPKYNVLFSYDDRNQVVEMWRSLGIKTFQVEKNNF